MRNRLALIVGVAAAAASLAMPSLAAAQETAYVTDSLRLGLHRNSQTSDRPFDNLLSGTPLAVIERNASYARVRTPGGQEGWVKSAFLVDDKPAALRVAELETELAGLRGQVDQAHSARTSAEAELDRLGKQVAQTTGSADRIHDTLERLERENADYEARIEEYRGSLPLGWVAAALGVALAAGFAAGLWWLDSLIRRRHGGFRIY
jgi:SH3 domain protein